MGSPVVHFEIMGKNSAALQSFYKRAFAWDVAPLGGETMIGRHVMGPVKSRPNGQN